MTEHILRELLEAARPFLPPLPQSDWLCHAGTRGGLAACAHCIEVIRFRAAFHVAEGQVEGDRLDEEISDAEKQWDLDHPDGISAEEQDAMDRYAEEWRAEEGCR